MAEVNQNEKLSAIVLAGERQATDELRQHHGVESKALIQIDGVPMIHRVLGALRDSDFIDELWLSGPAESAVASDNQLEDRIQSGEIQWRPPEVSPSTSAFEVMNEISDQRKVLLTTVDHSLLSSEIVDYFCRESLKSSADVTLGLSPYSLVRECFPTMKKTVLHFRDGDFCGCNLFTFLSAEGREVASFWRRIEKERKKPLRLIKLLGWRSVLSYRLGLLTLTDALEQLSDVLGFRVKAIILPFAHACVDVDSQADYEIIQASFSNQAMG